MLVLVVLVLQFVSRLISGATDLFFLLVNGAIRSLFALAALTVRAARVVRPGHRDTLRPRR